MPTRSVKKATGRPMTSEVYWALLGLAIERPSYGREYYHRYQRVYGDVHPVSSESHIYSALDALSGRGLIEEVPGPGDSRQPKPHYRATALGVRSYVGWIVEQVEAERRRQALWVRQLAIFVDTPAVALLILDRLRDQYLAQAGRAGSIGGAQGSREQLVEDLLAEHQRIGTGGMLKWLDHAVDSFQARLHAGCDDRSRA